MLPVDEIDNVIRRWFNSVRIWQFDTVPGMYRGMFDRAYDWYAVSLEPVTLPWLPANRAIVYTPDDEIVRAWDDAA